MHLLATRRRKMLKQIKKNIFLPAVAVQETAMKGIADFDKQKLLRPTSTDEKAKLPSPEGWFTSFLGGLSSLLSSLTIDEFVNAYSSSNLISCV